MNRLVRFLLSMGLVLTEPNRGEKMGHRLADRLEDLTDRASRRYENVLDRFERILREARSEDKQSAHLINFLVGIGVGVGVGVLFVPAKGDETRSAIAGKIHRFDRDVHERFSRETKPASGTEGKSA